MIYIYVCTIYIYIYNMPYVYIHICTIYRYKYICNGGDVPYLPLSLNTLFHSWHAISILAPQVQSFTPSIHLTLRNTGLKWVSAIFKTMILNGAAAFPTTTPCAASPSVISNKPIIQKRDRSTTSGSPHELYRYKSCIISNPCSWTSKNEFWVTRALPVWRLNFFLKCSRTIRRSHMRFKHCLIESIKQLLLSPSSALPGFP